MSAKYCPRCRSKWFGVRRRRNRCYQCGGILQRLKPPLVPVTSKEATGLDKNTIPHPQSGEYYANTHQVR